MEENPFADFDEALHHVFNEVSVVISVFSNGVFQFTDPPHVGTPLRLNKALVMGLLRHPHTNERELQRKGEKSVGIPTLCF